MGNRELHLNFSLLVAGLFFNTAGLIKLMSNGEAALTAGIAVNDLLIRGKTSSRLLFQSNHPSVYTWHNQYQLSIRLSS